MNYDRALATLNHARTGKPLEKKKLCNATWLRRMPNNGGEYLVDLVLFNKHIATWKPNGNIVLDSCGYKVVTTKDRYNRFLYPYRVWQNRPFWYIRTPTCVLPFRDEMELTADGRDLSRAPALNAIDATALKDKVYEYALLYTSRLVRGAISSVSDCTQCHRIPWSADSNELAEQDVVHLLHHMERDCTPPSIIEAAVNRLDASARCFTDRRAGPASRPHLREVIEVSWKEMQPIWRKPRTKKALLEQTELLMTRDDLPSRNLVPRQYIANLRMLVEDFLLMTFGFEWMPED